MLHPFIKNLVFVVQAPQSHDWGKPKELASISTKPFIPNEEENKNKFGIELAKSDKSFDAACRVFPDEVKVALWVSQNWLADPTVNAAKDLYGETVKLNKPILDKEQLASRVLEEADNCEERKDAIAALKLYAEIAGYTGKVEIDASTKNYTHNQMVIKLVKPNAEPILDLKSNDVQSDTTEELETPFKIKLVKAS